MSSVVNSVLKIISRRNSEELDELPPFYIDESDIEAIQSDDNFINSDHFLI